MLPLLSSALEQAQIAGLYVGLALLVAAALAAGRVSPQAAIVGGTILLVVGILISGPTRLSGSGWRPGARGGRLGSRTPARSACCSSPVETERIVTAMIVWSQVGIAGYLVGPVAGGAVAETLSFDWIGIVPLAAAAALQAFALALRGREAPRPDT